MKQYLMYLRKSRMDTDYEEVSVAETLSRHRTTLEKLCHSKKLHVAEVLEEVVSGESLSARPKMLRLLELVSTGMYAGVVCMDIERLSRGSSIQLNQEQKPAVDPVMEALETVQGQLASLQAQQDNICEYLEKGVYTVEMFTKRNAGLAKEIQKLQETEATLLREKENGSQADREALAIIPAAQHILDHYSILTVAEKNRLWKLVLKKATVYRSPDGELSVHIYPNLPR